MDNVTMPDNSERDSTRRLTDRNASQQQYVGRFAPSPSGLLHLGSVVAAVASLLDARAHHGRWLIRMEDIDGPREQPGAADGILRSLHELQMQPDEPVLWQSQRSQAYEQALQSLIANSLVYPCTCSRRTILQAITKCEATEVANTAVHTGAGNIVYPGTCRNKPIATANSDEAAAYRLRVTADKIPWADRAAGFRSGKTQSENLAESVGDFILKRRDGLWAYQLAVVVDDDFSGITDTVRGDDLADSTARQVYLQNCLGLTKQRTLHIPVVLDHNSNKLSKQQGAQPVVTNGPVASRIALLNQAVAHLGLTPVSATDLGQFWSQATRQWADSRWMAA